MPYFKGSTEPERAARLARYNRLKECRRSLVEIREKLRKGQKVFPIGNPRTLRILEREGWPLEYAGFGFYSCDPEDLLRRASAKPTFWRRVITWCDENMPSWLTGRRYR